MILLNFRYDSSKHFIPEFKLHIICKILISDIIMYMHLITIIYFLAFSIFTNFAYDLSGKVTCQILVTPSQYQQNQLSKAARGLPPNKSCYKIMVGHDLVLNPSTNNLEYLPFNAPAKTTQQKTRQYRYRGEYYPDWDSYLEAKRKAGVRTRSRK